MIVPRARESQTFRAPALHFWLTGPRIDLLLAVALLPPLIQALVLQGPRYWTLLAICIAVTVGWQAIFAWTRGQRLGLSAVVPAIAFVLLVPDDVALWQAAMGLSFGVVVGVHLFGGYGWNFLNPTATALTFLYFSFPEAGYGSVSPVAWQTCIPGAALLLAAGIVSWRIVVGAAVSLIVVTYFAPSAGTEPLSALAGFTFVLVFLACDPVAAPATDPGRWIHGILVGGLAAVGLASAKPMMEVFVTTALLGGIFAPLIDHAATYAKVRRRDRRNGVRHG